MLHSYVVGEYIHSSASRRFPSDFGVWDIAGDDASGYTMTNVGLNMPLVLTPENTLAGMSVGTPAKFTFAKRGDNGRVSVALSSGAGTWEIDPSLAPVRATVRILPEDTESSLQEFTFRPFVE
ncbi:unnamed protein product [Mycena citricolor]|uniref:Uncharacterized protein n=1 Tax=Mycena citricolor TaxID=2018698 RepID=A0AAD2HVQ0_9AGAR|nr:unnamed protein product [Mycena citricolor]